MTTEAPGQPAEPAEHNRQTRNRLILVAVLILVLAGLLTLNHALMNWWLSWGPPTPDPAYHVKLSKLYLVLSADIFLTAGVVLSFLKKKPRPAGEAPETSIVGDR